MSPYPLIALVVFAALALCLWPLLESGKKAMACSAIVVLSVAAAAGLGAWLSHDPGQRTQCAPVGR